MNTTSELERLYASFAARGLLRDDGNTIYGQPALRSIRAGHEPQKLMDASTLQKRLVEYAYSTPSPGENACAEWVEEAFSRFGYGIVSGHAFEIYEGYCALTDSADLKVGMVVSVARHPFSVNGRSYGHVGIYVGDSRVRECVDAGLRDVPLELWLSYYGVMCEPRWGWLGSIALDC